MIDLIILALLTAFLVFAFVWGIPMLVEIKKHWQRFRYGISEDDLLK